MLGVDRDKILLLLFTPFSIIPLFGINRCNVIFALLEINDIVL